MLRTIFHAGDRKLIDTDRKEIMFTDNGPGIEDREEERVFLPFVSTKPPGEGKWLGVIYLTREIASYHNAAIHMSDERKIHAERQVELHFAFDLEQSPMTSTTTEPTHPVNGTSGRLDITNRGRYRRRI